MQDMRVLKRKDLREYAHKNARVREHFVAGEAELEAKGQRPEQVRALIPRHVWCLWMEEQRMRRLIEDNAWAKGIADWAPEACALYARCLEMCPRFALHMGQDWDLTWTAIVGGNVYGAAMHPLEAGDVRLLLLQAHESIARVLGILMQPEAGTKLVGLS